MFGKTNAFTIETARADLDAIIAKAESAYVPADRIVDLLESRAAALRARMAATANLSTVPLNVVIKG